MRPDRVTMRLVRVLLLGGAVILFLLSSALLIVQLVLPARASVTQSSPARDCPDAPPVNAKTEPTLTFCSPINQGFVGGPYGTHIVLIGENFPARYIKWFYTQKKTLFDIKAVQACFTGKQSCPLSRLADPTTEPDSAGSLFRWTWNSASSFPQTTGDYFLLAIINNQKGFVSIVSSVPFTLLSSQAPCIVADNDSASKDCSRTQRFQLSSSTSSQMLTLKGSNWLLQGPGKADVGANVVITLTCDPTSTISCSQAQLSQLKATADASGHFTRPLSLPANLVGTYDICAASQAQTVATPITSPQNSDTVVNDSLTYGCAQQIDTTGLIITIKPPVPIPSPTPNPVLTTIGNVLDVLSILTLLPIIAALLLYFIYSVRILFARPSPPTTTNTTPREPSQGGNQQNANGPAPSSFQEDRPQSNYPLTNELWWQSTTVRTSKVAHNFVPLSKKVVRKKARNIGQLIARGQLVEIRTIAQQVLVVDDGLWDKIRESLHKAPPPAIPPDAAEQAFEKIRQINIQDRNSLLPLCSEAIILYEMVLPTLSSYPVHAADVAYNLGYAYFSLSTSAPSTGQFLLQLAISLYTSALNVYRNKGLYRQQEYTQSSINNAYIALSKLSSNYSD